MRCLALISLLIPLAWSSVIDGHVHITNLQQLQYTWQAHLPQLNHSYSLGNLTDVSSKAAIHPSVAIFIEVSAKPSFWLDEVRWVQQVAEKQHKDPAKIQIGAIIGHAALE